jgi:hypothetical protein
MNLQQIHLNQMLGSLIDLCKQELELDSVPDIQLLRNHPTIPGSASFGVFDGSIKVVSKDRHPMDVMRTVAHELVHWKQKVSGHEMDGSDGSATENQANAVAGAIMRKFGKKYPGYFSTDN